MKEKKDKGLTSFFSLIKSTNIPKVALTIGLMASIITTLAGLVVPMLTKNLVDGFSMSSLSTSLLVAIGVAFIFQAIVNGISVYLLTAVGQRIVASLRDKMWVKLIRLPVKRSEERRVGKG